MSIQKKVKNVINSWIDSKITLTYLFENKIVFKTGLAERVTTESSDTFLDEFHADGADELFKSILS